MARRREHRRAPGDPGVLVVMLALTCTARNPAYRPPSADAADGSETMVSLDAGRRQPQAARDAFPSADRLAPQIDAPAPEPDAGSGAPDRGMDAAAMGEDLTADVSSAPPRLAVSEGTTLAKQGGTGGATHTDLCPQDEVLIGYRGTLNLDNGGDLVVVSLVGQCGRLGVAGTGPYTITVTSADRLPGRGTSAAMTFTSVCGTNQVVVGMQGRAGTLLDQLQLQCAPLSIADAAAGSVSIGARTVLAAKGGTGGIAFQAPCPAGQVARGQTVSDGAAIDALGLVCGTPAALAP